MTQKMKLTITNGTVIMRMPLMLGPVAGHVALRLGDGDYSRLAPQHPVIFVPLGVRRMLRAVIPAALALRAAALARHHDCAVVHLPTLLHATPTLHEAVLETDIGYLLDLNNSED